MPFRLAVFCPVVKRRSAILALCRAYFHKHAYPCTIVSFTSYEGVLSDTSHYDAYLLPLVSPMAGQQLPNGLLLARALRARGMLNPIIFVSSNPEWAYEAFRVDALQYLPIPLSSETLFPALERAITLPCTPVFALTTPEGVFGIPYEEIESVECSNHTLFFHRLKLGTLRSVTLRVPLREALAPLLRDPRFIQPHRSFVINMYAVAQLSANEFIMKSGASIPIPRERYATIKTAYLAFLESTLSA